MEGFSLWSVVETQSQNTRRQMETLPDIQTRQKDDLDSVRRDLEATQWAIITAIKSREKG